MNVFFTKQAEKTIILWGKRPKQQRNKNPHPQTGKAIKNAAHQISNQEL